MKIGIVGLPNVGKSTLFKALTRKKVDISNYPFCTIEPNVGIVTVPDERLGKLARMSKSRKVIPAVIEFVDIAGLVKGASVGEGLGNKFLSHIREVDAIVEVVRVFSDEKITHVNNRVDPLEDIEVLNMELILADLETIKKGEMRLEKEKKGNIKNADKKLETVLEIKKNLGEGKLAREAKINRGDEIVEEVVRDLSLLTMKPILYIYNVKASQSFQSEALERLERYPGVRVDIKIEEELSEMDEKEKKELELESSLSELITKSYALLNLITFLTTGEDESRAWTIVKGSTAPEAGAAIHTDFKEKFIRAEVIFWEKLLEAGSWSRSRELGWLRTEGKEYVVKDGDVIEFRI